jgi:outer membrane protein assembly complex protein YaeT
MTIPNTDLQVTGGSFQAQLQGQTAQVNATLPVDGSQLTAQGTVPLTRTGRVDVDVTGTANLALVQQFTDLANASGIANVDVQVTGTLTDPEFAGQVVADDITVTAPRWNVEYSQVDLRANFVDTRAQVAVSGLLNGSPIKAQGVVPLDAAGQMNLNVKGTVNLSMVEQLTEQVNATGQAVIDVNIEGTFSDPDFSGVVQAQDITITAPEYNVTYASAELDVTLIDSRFEIVSEGLLNGSELDIDAVVPLEEGAGDVALTLHSFPLSTLTPGQDLSGSLTVLVDATGTGTKPENWSGQVEIRPDDLSIVGRPIQLSQPIRVVARDGRAVLQPVRLQSGEFMNLNLQGMVDFESGVLDGSIQGNTDLVLAQVFLDNTIITGNLTTNVEIGGTIQQPDLSGRITVDDGVYRKFNTPILLEDIHLVAPVTEDRIEIQTLTASMGGGEITGQGTIQLEGIGLGEVNITAEARGIGMQYPQGLRSQISADVRFRSLEEDYQLSGEVRVIRSAYRSEFDPTERLVNTMLRQRRALTAPPVEEDQIQLDLQIRTIEDFQMRNNIGRIQAGANLNITGFVNEPRLSGEIRIRERSEIYFEGNTFEVQRGLIQFYGDRRIDPFFDIELFTIATDEETRQDYEITIPLYGRVSEIGDRQPTSYPSLTAQQIYFLILTGQANAQVTTAGGIFFQRQLAAYISGQMFSDVGQELAGALGLTRIEVRPELFATDTDPGAKLVITKDFTSALSLVYSTSLTDSDEYTWLADYKAPKNLTFRFINEDEGNYTGSVRHLVRFGAGESTGSLRSRRRLRDRTIESISLTNKSVLSDPEVRDILDIEVGDDYDYWMLTDQVGEVGRTLQERGYLFPLTELEEERITRGEYAVKILIEDRGKRQMIFRGYEPTTDQRNKYLRFWREGFSVTGVMMFIREDLLEGLWLRGYYKAEVRTETTEGSTITHAFIIEPGTRYADVQLRFEGTEKYPAEELEDDLKDLYRERRALASDAIHSFDSLRDKIQALYVQRGFLGTEVERGAVAYLPSAIAQRTVKIEEGPISKIVAVEASGVDALPQQLQQQLRLNVGAVFNSQMLVEDEYAIQDYYERQGYMEAQVDSDISRNTKTGGITVHYDVQTGQIATVASIEISGYTHTDRELIEERIQLNEGEILTRQKLIRAHRNLSDLRIFHQVTVEATEMDETGRQVVTVKVIDRNHYEVRYGVRYDTEQDFGGDIQISDINLFGTGKNVSLYTRQSQRNREYGTTFHTPALDEDLQYKTLIVASYETGELLLLQDNERFDGHRLHLSIQRQRRLTGKYILVGGYDFQNLTLTPLEAFDIDPVEDLNVSRVLGTVYADTRDDPVNAMRGAFLSTDLQYSASWLGSDVNYVKNYNQYFLFKKFGNKVWASAYRLGLASDLPTRVITERFFTGGSYSLRGFEKDSVGPRNAAGTVVGGEALFVINQEYRFPIYKWFGGVVFYDLGNVYESVGSFDPLDLRHSLGIGLRFSSPFGILRADYGINLDPEGDERRGVFHFGLGQAF